MQIVQERISARSRFRRREAGTPDRLKMLFGGTDRAREDEMIAVAFAPVSGMIDQRTQDVQAEPADWPVGDGPIEVGRGGEQRIERRSVVTELDRQLSAT